MLKEDVHRRGRKVKSPAKGFVTVTISSPVLFSQTLLQLVKHVIPDEDTWHRECLRLTGVVPEEIKIRIHAAKEKDE